MVIFYNRILKLLNREYYFPGIGVMYQGITFNQICNRMITGARLRLLRNLRGLPQKQAAYLLNISQPAYCKLEKKEKINGHRLAQIKKAFNCSDRDIEILNSLTPPKVKNKFNPFKIFMSFRGLAPNHQSDIPALPAPHTCGYSGALY